MVVCWVADIVYLAGGDTVFVFDDLEQGIYTPRPSVETLSNAMDVGNPSNFARMLALYENDVRKRLIER